MKRQMISPVQVSDMAVQRLILAELMKISDILSNKPVRDDYTAEVQNRIGQAVRKMVKATPANSGRLETEKMKEVG